MNHERILFVAVLVDISHIERVRRREVQLYGDKRVFFAVNVFNLNVEFRSVERRFVVRFDVIEPDIVENFFHKRFRFVPRLVVVDIFDFILAAFAETESNVFSHSEAL